MKTWKKALFINHIFNSFFLIYKADSIKVNYSK